MKLQYNNDSFNNMQNLTIKLELYKKMWNLKIKEMVISTTC